MEDGGGGGGGLDSPPSSSSSQQADRFAGPNLVLGSADVDTQLLADIVKGYFAQQQQQQQPSQSASAISGGAGEDPEDRRRYQGKYKNSPMLIKLMSSTK